MRQFVLRALCAVLVIFHAALLLQRFADASIFEPVVLGRWIAAAAILGGALLVRRFAPQAGGRRGLVAFWLLVFLLHVPAAGIEAELIAQIAVAVVLVFIGLAAPATALQRQRFRSFVFVPIRSVARRMLIPPRCPPIR